MPGATRTSSLRGILFMLLAMGSITINNAMVKLAVTELPLLETMFLRAVIVLGLGLPLLGLTSSLADTRHMLAPRVLARNLVESGASICFVFAVANAPLADLTAILQLTPVLTLLGAVVFFGDRVGRGALALVALALFGALLVAQPGSSGFQPFLLFGLLSATLSAGRDIIGRGVERSVPAFAVALGVSLFTAIATGVLTLSLEKWVAPSLGQMVLIGGAGALLTLAQLLMFLSFRVGETSAVLPFAYSGMLWALPVGALLFGTVPNPLALVGMGLILLSGVLVVLRERRASAAAPDRAA